MKIMKMKSPGASKMKNGIFISPIFTVLARSDKWAHFCGMRTRRPHSGDYEITTVMFSFFDTPRVFQFTFALFAFRGRYFIFIRFHFIFVFIFHFPGTPGDGPAVPCLYNGGPDSVTHGSDKWGASPFV